MRKWLGRVIRRLVCLVMDCTWETVPGMSIECCKVCGDLRTFCHVASCSVKVAG